MDASALAEYRRILLVKARVSVVGRTLWLGTSTGFASGGLGLGTIPLDNSGLWYGLGFGGVCGMIVGLLFGAVGVRNCGSCAGAPRLGVVAGLGLQAAGRHWIGGFADHRVRSGVLLYRLVHGSHRETRGTSRAVCLTLLTLVQIRLKIIK